jgi:opacity protein-like surface antigen
MAYLYLFLLMIKNLLLSTLVSLPLLSTAQTTATSFASHFYVGAGVTVHSSKPFHDYGYSSTQVGPVLTAGLRFTPRLALQLSGAYTWLNTRESHDSFFSDSGVAQGTFDLDSRGKLLTLPLLLRATFTDLAKRLRVDALGGPMLLYSRTNVKFSTTYQGQATPTTSDTYVDTSFSFALGPGLRYTLTPRVDLALDALVNMSINGTYRTFNDRLFSNVRAGVHYNFGE